MAPLKRIQNWLGRPQRTNRDALVVGVVGAAVSAVVAYAVGRALGAADIIDSTSTVPVWMASLSVGVALGVGLLLRRRSVRGLRLYPALGHRLEARRMGCRSALLFAYDVRGTTRTMGALTGTCDRAGTAGRSVPVRGGLISRSAR
jgi:hypothetical protein